MTRDGNLLAWHLINLSNFISVGHCHPKVVKAGSEQMGLISTNNRFLNDELVKCARNLVERMPGDSLSVCYFVNSGSEANDLALRLARAHTQQRDIITLDQWVQSFNNLSYLYCKHSKAHTSESWCSFFLQILLRIIVVDNKLEKTPWIYLYIYDELTRRSWR